MIGHSDICTGTQKYEIHMAYEYGLLLQYGYLHIIHFNEVFRYKPSIWGSPTYGNPYRTMTVHHICGILLAICPVAGFMSMWTRPALWIDSKPSKTSSKRASVKRLRLEGTHEPRNDGFIAGHLWYEPIYSS